MEYGHIRLSRKFFKNILWQEQRVFSRAEAWLWMIAQARYLTTSQKMLMNGKIIEWNRGQLPASIRYLSEAWGWSNTKVVRFLNLLKTEHMVSVEKRQGQIVVTLLNYDTYNSMSDAERNTDEHTDEQMKRQNRKKVNKEKKVNIYRKNSKPLVERKKDFIEGVRKYQGKYDNALLNDFVLYWTEKHKTQDEMRFEGQDYFDMGKRLGTFKHNRDTKNYGTTNTPKRERGSFKGTGVYTELNGTTQDSLF